MESTIVSRTLRSLVLAAAILAAGLPASAQEEAQSIFSGALDVQAVNVEVVVTDRRGRRVDGLTAADFRLLVDGQEVPAEYFAEIRDGRAQVAAAPPEGVVVVEDGAAAAALPAPPELERAEELGNSYLIFIDESAFLPLFHLRDEALRGIARDLSTMRPQDRVAVVAYNGRIQVLSPWTHGGPAVQELFAQMIRNNGPLAAARLNVGGLEASSGLQLSTYSNSIDRAFESSSSLLGSLEVSIQLRAVGNAVSAASASMRAFSAVPGRKILMLLSGGWLTDFRPFKAEEGWEGLLSAVRLDGGGGEKLLEPLLDTANLLGFTIYPVHLHHGPDVLPDASQGGNGRFWSQQVLTFDLMKHSMEQSSLVKLAQDTGGRLLLLGRNRHLSKVLADTSSYYWLGFTHAGDNRRRTLKVEVRRPGLKVRSRNSFVPLSRPVRITMEMESALLTGEMGGMGPLGVSVGELRKIGGNRAELPVTLRIPADQIDLVEQSGRHVGQLELRIGALDHRGDRSDVPMLPIVLSQPEAPRPGSVIRYDTTLQLRNAPQHLQFVIYDLLSGKSFGERVRVEP